jgi:Flp pilus assembly protein CpaB
VDVMVTHELPKEDAPEDATGKEAIEKITETLLSNIKVLAVDQRATGGALPQEGGKENAKRNMPSSISLEVTLEEAQRLRLAQDTGYLSMTLRSLEDRDVIDPAVVTRVEDVTTTGAYDAAGNKSKSDTVTIIRGTEAQEAKIPQAPKADTPEALQEKAAQEARMASQQGQSPSAERGEQKVPPAQVSAPVAVTKP